MPSRFVPGWVFVAAAAATAVLVVLPATAWLIDHDRLKIPAWLVAGILAGLAPALLGVLSATLGLWYRGGWTNVQWVFAHGAPIPGLGTFRWMPFLTFVGWSCLVGVAATLAAHAATRRPPSVTRRHRGHPA